MSRLSMSMLYLSFACLLYAGIGNVMRLGTNIYSAQQQAQSSRDQYGTIEITSTPQDRSSGKLTEIGDLEIRYDGKLYDVVSRRNDGDKLILNVKWDEREEGLIKEVGEYIETLFDQSPGNEKKDARLTACNIDKEYLPLRNIFRLIPDLFTLQSVAHLQSRSYSSVIAEIHSPPPRP